MMHELAGIAKGAGTCGNYDRLWRVWIVVCSCGWGSDDHLTEATARRAHRKHVAG